MDISNDGYHPRPPVPSPSATSAEVQLFLMKMFLALDHPSTTEAAKEKARKLNTDGQGLYDLTQEDWREIYSFQGGIIWKYLYGSCYGYVLLTFSSLSPHFSIYTNLDFIKSRVAVVGPILQWFTHYVSSSSLPVDSRVSLRKETSNSRHHSSQAVLLGSSSTAYTTSCRQTAFETANGCGQDLKSGAERVRKRQDSHNGSRNHESWSKKSL